MKIDAYVIAENTNIVEVMEKIEANAKGVVFVCTDGKLIASVSDGDVRRHLLRNGKLTDDISVIYNKNPQYVYMHQKNRVNGIMSRYGIRAVPVINHEGKIIDICFGDDGQPDKITGQKNLHVPLVIMAGGKGRRLKPYTDILPKPLIPVGDKTITERIMDSFAKYECRHVWMIINYKKDFIKAYFKDSEIQRNITFIEEQEYLGTGGGLKLLEGSIKGTFFMSNCDILLNVDYSSILEYHRNARNIITLVCARKCFEIPYGTIEIKEDGQVAGLEEKPEFMYHVNTGFYVIESDFLGKIPENTPVPITDVIKRCVGEGSKVGTYLIDDTDWMDMGQLDELEKMKEKLGVS